MKFLVFLLLLDLLSNARGSQLPHTDAILFRTHLVDHMILQKLIEISNELRPSKQLSDDSANSLKPCEYELNILYDKEATPDFGERLAQAGFDVTRYGVGLFPLTLASFTKYPNVKPVPISKSHYQHVAYTAWWEANSMRKNWRFVRTPSLFNIVDQPLL